MFFKRLLFNILRALTFYLNNFLSFKNDNMYSFAITMLFKYDKNVYDNILLTSPKI